ncbi:MetQ/NlpA family ABC transporter substrate-binding protein [Acrocarpospora macrocephala]|uniref:Thiamine biosynthesis protein n=1 Tax=Acrocarpospora macrocephala TaxID=150177 RepID=A0A5M3WTI5_9ACTN|nr:ABC transporter substrate-binding protein [Acrocarpospora macrocephala]GES09458.1 thiamine biosynthesis protein [Acrocarpospora macrocephala]
MKTNAGLLRPLAVAAALFAASACGGAGTEPSAAVRTITVGVQPNTPFAVVPLGVRQGLFQKHGLDVKIKVISTATTIPPALLADQLQFSNWSFASFATLADKKLPLKIVGPGDTAGRTLENDYIQLLTLKDGGATSVAGLTGKKIAVNSLASLTEVQVKMALKNAGVNPASVSLVPIPFPDQLAALTSGRVDAIGAGEPFLTLAKQKAELNALAALNAEIMPDLPLSLWMTSENYLQQHPEVVRAFQLGLKDSLEYARANPDALRKFIPEFAGVDAAVADKMILPTWTTSVDQAKVQRIAEIMHEYGAVASTPDMSKYILPFPIEAKG